jgi:hypothetical protein
MPDVCIISGMQSFTINPAGMLNDSKIEEPRYAHYAESVSVTEGYVIGKPVAALCGVVFVPSNDPLKFPICPICKKIVEALFLGEE